MQKPRFKNICSQKLLLAPEYCTSRMMDNLEEDRKQRLNDPALLPAEPTEEDVEIVKAYEPAFEGQLIVAIEMFESMRDLLRQYKVGIPISPLASGPLELLAYRDANII
ncbi:MAG: hypothetical protein Q9204_008601 [Flavoplaca sp. TL-2023a]